MRKGVKLLDISNRKLFKENLIIDFLIKFDLEGDLYERRTHLLANSKLRKYS